MPILSSRRARSRSNRSRSAARSTLAGREIAIRVGRLAAGVVGHYANKGVQPSVVRLDATEARLGDLGRSEVPRSQLASEPLNRQRVNDVRHGW